MGITKLLALPVLVIGLVVATPAAAQATESVTLCARTGPDPCPVDPSCDFRYISGTTTPDENGTPTYWASQVVCVTSDTYRALGGPALEGAVIEAVSTVLIAVKDYLP